MRCFPPDSKILLAFTLMDRLSLSFFSSLSFCFVCAVTLSFHSVSIACPFPAPDLALYHTCHTIIWANREAFVWSHTTSAVAPHQGLEACRQPHERTTRTGHHGGLLRPQGLGLTVSRDKYPCPYLCKSLIVVPPVTKQLG